MATLADLTPLLAELTAGVAQNTQDISDIAAALKAGVQPEDLQPAVDAVKAAVSSLQDAHVAVLAALTPPTA